MRLIFGRGKKEIRVRVNKRDPKLTLKRFSVEGVKAGLECHFCVEANYECRKCRLARQIPALGCHVAPGLGKADAARSDLSRGYGILGQRKRQIAILRNFRKRIMRAVERGKKCNSK